MGGGVWICKAVLEHNLTISFKGGKVHTSSPTTSIPGITTDVFINVCGQMFLSALFIIQKNWKEPKYLLIEDASNYGASRIIVQYYTAITKHELPEEICVFY